MRLVVLAGATNDHLSHIHAALRAPRIIAAWPSTPVADVDCDRFSRFWIAAVFPTGRSRPPGHGQGLASLVTGRTRGRSGDVGS
jgi:hypothetical protein